MNKLTIITLIWCLTRIARGIWGTFEKIFYSWVLVSLTEGRNDTLVAPMLTIVLFIIVEVIPIMIVLDWSFMEIFVFKMRNSLTNYN